MIRAFYILIPLIIMGNNLVAAQDVGSETMRRAEEIARQGRFQGFDRFLSEIRMEFSGKATLTHAITGYQVGAPLTGRDQRMVMDLLAIHNGASAVGAATDLTAELLSAMRRAGGVQSAAGRILQLIDPIASQGGLRLSLAGDSAVQVTLPASDGRTSGGQVFYVRPGISESAGAGRGSEQRAGRGAISLSYATSILIAMKSLHTLNIQRLRPVSLILDVDGAAVQFQDGVAVTVLAGCDVLVTGTEGYVDLTLTFRDDSRNRRRRSVLITNIRLSPPGVQRPSATAELSGQNLDRAETTLAAFAGAYIENNGGRFSIMTDRRQNSLLLTVTENENGLGTALMHLFDYLSKAASNIRFQTNGFQRVGRYWQGRMTADVLRPETGYPVLFSPGEGNVRFTERYTYPPGGDADSLVQSVEARIANEDAGIERYDIDIYPAVAFSGRGEDGRLWREAVERSSGRSVGSTISPATERPGGLPNLIRAGYCTPSEQIAYGSDSEYRSRDGMATLLAITTETIARGF